MDAKQYYDMPMDDLENIIIKKKQELKALEKLMKVRREFGEKTSKQIKAAEKARAKTGVKPQATQQSAQRGVQHDLSASEIGAAQKIEQQVVQQAASIVPKADDRG